MSLFFLKELAGDLPVVLKGSSSSSPEEALQS